MASDQSSPEKHDDQILELIPVQPKDEQIIPVTISSSKCALLESMMQEALKEWLNARLPGIVDKLVEQKISELMSDKLHEYKRH